MAYKVIINKRFTKKVVKVSQYLEKDWSIKVAQDFLAKVDEKIDLISKHPTIGSPSQKIAGIRKVILTRHNHIYYRVRDKKVIFVNMLAPRQDPKKNKYG